MALFLLKRNVGDDIGYDELLGVLVRAPDEATARVMAHASGGDEVGQFVGEPQDAWLVRATCVLVLEDGEQAIIIRDFRSG